eukprot:6099099-Amphidinium_carterae.1
MKALLDVIEPVAEHAKVGGETLEQDGISVLPCHAATTSEPGLRCWLVVWVLTFAIRCVHP